jgi:hypothetical protein
MVVDNLLFLDAYDSVYYDTNSMRSYPPQTQRSMVPDVIYHDLYSQHNMPLMYP